MINGSVVYSTAITASTTAVSAAGETLSFQIMNGSVYVMNGPARAQIIRTDVPSKFASSSYWPVGLWLEDDCLLRLNPC